MVLRISRARAQAALVGHLVVAPGLAAGGATGGEGEAAAGVVDALACVQIDPLLVVERNHELVLHARVPDYGLGGLERALYEHRTLVEVLAPVRCIAPAADFPYYRPVFARVAREHRERVAPLEPLMAEIVARLEREGPLASADLEQGDRVSGWWDADGEHGTRAVAQALEWLWHFGEVMIAHRRGAVRYFDLTRRLIPGADTFVDEDTSRHYLARRYLRAAGLVHPGEWRFGFARLKASQRHKLLAAALRAGEAVEVEIEGVRTRYYAHRDLLPRLEAAGGSCPERCCLLPPLDNLLWDRRRLAEVFGFEYSWEIYVPARRRRYGPYTMPALFGDALVARVDARTDRGRGELVVNGVWWEPAYEGSPELEAALEEALHRLAGFVLKANSADSPPAGS